MDMSSNRLYSSRQVLEELQAMTNLITRLEDASNTKPLTKTTMSRVALSSRSMRTPAKLLADLAVRVRGLILVGANDGGELSEYVGARIRHALLIEPQPEPLALLRSRIVNHPHFHVIQALCSNIGGATVPFYSSSNGGKSSSMLAPTGHLATHPTVSFAEKIFMTTTTVDDIKSSFLAANTKYTKQHFNLLAVDVQGAELLVLRGAERTLPDMAAVWCEISHIELYSEGAKFEEIFAFLILRGFRLFWTSIGRKFHGDALFVRPELVGRR